MPLLTIVQDYIFAALKRAAVERLEDGTLVAYVPEIRGVLAFGADQHECARELWKLLDEWVQVSLVNGHRLPVFEGIDLNTDSARILTTYHHPVEGRSESGEFFADEDELAAGFERHARAR